MNKYISYKIMKVEEFKDSSYYRIACDCGTPEQDLEVEVEFDEYGILWLTLSGQHTVSDWWGHPSWLGRMKKRIKLSLRLLFTGWFEANGEFLILREEHIDSIISFLQSVKQKKRKMVKAMEKKAKEKKDE